MLAIHTPSRTSMCTRAVVSMRSAAMCMCETVCCPAYATADVVERAM
jgi:hypothetical protein